MRVARAALSVALAAKPWRVIKRCEAMPEQAEPVAEHSVALVQRL
jgi:hypothetical protein